MNNSASYYAQMEATLDAAKSHYSTIVNVITDIKNGIPDSIACKKHGITIAKFRKEVYTRKPFIIDKDLEPLDPDTLLFTHPDFQIWSDLTYINLTEDSMKQIPLDIHETLESVFSDLDARVSKAIHLRYYHHETFETIGKEIGDVTAERARQIIHRAFSKLRWDTEAITRITYGDWALGVIRKKQETYRNNLLRKISDGLIVQDYASPKDYLYLSVNNIDLSCRAKNALARANVKSIGEVLRLIKNDELIMLRNVGYNTEYEIKDKVLNFVKPFIKYSYASEEATKHLEECELDKFVKDSIPNL